MSQVAVITRTRTIAAEPAAVWDVLADFGALSTWVPDVDHSCLLAPGPDGAAVGTSRRVQMGRDTLVETIIEFDPQAALAYRIEGVPGPLRDMSNRWTLRPRGAHTEVAVTSSVRVAAGPVSAPAGWVVSRVMARKSDDMLTGLARRVETQ